MILQPFPSSNTLVYLVRQSSSVSVYVAETSNTQSIPHHSQFNADICAFDRTHTYTYTHPHIGTQRKRFTDNLAQSKLFGQMARSFLLWQRRWLDRLSTQLDAMFGNAITSIGCIEQGELSGPMGIIWVSD